MVTHEKRGAVINIAPTRALMSEASTETYSASKGGIAALTHATAISLGARGIRVNAESPGWIETRGRKHPRPVDAGTRRAASVRPRTSPAPACTSQSRPAS